MKIDKGGLRFLLGALKTCLFEKGDFLSADQEKFACNVKSEVDFVEITKLFPLESEAADRLMETAKFLGKDIIDSEVVLVSFGGDRHIEYVAEDFFGLPESLTSILSVFHLVVPVRLEEENGKLVGIYENGDVKFRLEGIETINKMCLEINNPGLRALIHYGSIFDVIPAGSREEKILLEAQAKSKLFMETCRKNRSLDCEKILRALQFQKSKSK